MPIEKLYALAGKVSLAFINGIENLDGLVAEFWKGNSHKLKSPFLAELTGEDIIVSACPRFIIEGVAERLPTRHILCSEFHTGTGVFEFVCYRENKVKALAEKFPGCKINRFYTDSYNDKALMLLAQEVYLVKGDKVTRLSLADIEKG